jgi:hypothetical protein
MNRMTDIITGERIQETCDVYLGLPEDFKYNPRIFKQYQKCLCFTEIPDVWDNPHKIFCYGDRITFFRKIMHRLQNKCIFVTHNSDKNIINEFLDIADNNQIDCWYAQNVMVDHPKIKILPIGIANSMWSHGDTSIIESVRRKNNVKSSDFYFYFNVRTNRAERSPCQTKIETKGLKFGYPASNFQDYIDLFSTYKYAISPPGNGVDCHRTWECFYLNVIPILKRSILTEKIRNHFFVFCLMIGMILIQNNY